LTSQALLALVAAAFAAGYGGLAASTLALYGTSVKHWRKPRYGSFARRLDLAAVAANVVYATVLACTRATSRAWTATWLVGVGGIAAVFVANEAVFALQLRAPAAKRDAGDATRRGADWATAPGTPQRSGVYRRNAAVHGGCVHVLASALGCAMVSKGLRPR
jgi:predicted NodU family carbamoyl transferase